MAGGDSFGGLASLTKQQKTWWPGALQRFPTLLEGLSGIVPATFFLKDKDNLIDKVGRVSTPVIMDLLAVVLG
jgi:hypothetical protein